MKTLARFLTVGVVNTLVGLTCIYAAMALLGLGLVASNAIGYAVGVAISFMLNRSWTFGQSGAWGGPLARWLGVVAVSYACNIAAASFAHRSLGVDAYVAQLVGVVVYTAVSFLGAKLFAFAPPRRALAG